MVIARASGLLIMQQWVQITSKCVKLLPLQNLKKKKLKASIFSYAVFFFQRFF